VIKALQGVRKNLTGEQVMAAKNKAKFQLTSLAATRGGLIHLSALLTSFLSYALD
jgi:hypothetical protein